MALEGRLGEFDPDTYVEPELPDIGMPRQPRGRRKKKVIVVL